LTAATLGTSAARTRLGADAERTGLDTGAADLASWDVSREFSPYVPAQASAAAPIPVPPGTARTAERER
jgi:hypothetical protein